jgi:hypothetical protein
MNRPPAACDLAWKARFAERQPPAFDRTLPTAN